MPLKTLIIMVHIDFDWHRLSVVGLGLVWMEVKSSIRRTSYHWQWVASSGGYCWTSDWADYLPTFYSATFPFV